MDEFMEGLMKLVTKFDELDRVYQNNNFMDDNNVIEILNIHRNLEARYVADELPETPKEIGISGEYFHKENIATIDYLIENIDNGHQHLDALLYLYPLMIYRYSDSSSMSEFFTTIEKFQGYLTRLQLAFNSRNLNIGSIATTLMRFFYNRKNPLYAQELVDLITYRRLDWRYSFQFCRILLYDKEFCKTSFPYDGNLHRGAYILFDVVLHELLSGRNADRELWVKKFVTFFERNSDIQFDIMPDFYSMFSKLYSCSYLSFDKNNINSNLRNSFNSLKLPEFETGENIFRLYYLYSQKLICLDNLGENEKVIEVCDYLLEILQKSDASQFAYYIERINWRKYAALKSLDGQRHENWFFEVIADSEFGGIGNKVYFSPFMTLDDSVGVDSLYHFTDLKALESIIKNKSLWLTRYDFLNDTEEIRYIANIIADYDDVSEHEFMVFMSECLAVLDDYFNDKIENELLSAIKTTMSNIYVLSNSVREDNLSLWHYYAGGAGCSIKIDASELRKQIEGYNPSLGNKNAQVFMRKINYGFDFTDSTLLDTLRTIFNNDMLSCEHKKFLICIHIIYEGIFVKNPNISQEEEFRVAVIIGNEPEYTNSRIVPKFRVSKNTFIPYIELSVDSQVLIKEICIAPLNKTDIAKKGLDEFLRHNGFEVTPEMVKVSAIKLRY